MSDTTYDWRITEQSFSPDGLVSYAKLELLVNDEIVLTEHFTMSHEFGPCETAREAAASYAYHWHESQTKSLEERLADAWEEELNERRGA